MTRIVLLALFLALVPAVAGCGGSDDETSPGGTAATGSQVETPEEIRNVVWERSYSECASYDLQRLSRKYHVAPREDDIADAVSASWTERFKGGDDALRTGRDGCLKGFEAQ